MIIFLASINISNVVPPLDLAISAAIAHTASGLEVSCGLKLATYKFENFCRLRFACYSQLFKEKIIEVFYFNT